MVIRGVDDNGTASAGEVVLTLPPGQARTINAQDLEAGAHGLDGSLGVGAGKWQLQVDADARIVVMTLLESRTGHVTNLSAPTSSLSIPLFIRADDPSRQGFLRIVNRSDEAGTVTIRAIDDFGNAASPVSLTIGAGAVRHLNSNDLEAGARGKGLSGRTGPPTEGNWRLELITSLDIETYSYVRTTGGFLTSMHDLAPTTGNRHEIVIFNPGSNESQVSMLRLVNPSAEDAEVTISAVDDAGEPGQAEVVLTLPGGHSKELTAQQLETGGNNFTGWFGDGTGKWRLTVNADRTIQVMSLLEAGTVNLTNLSTRASRRLR